MRFLVMPALALGLAACGSSPAIVQPPAELTAVSGEASVSRVWHTEAGRGAGDHYLSLPPLAEGKVGYLADYRGQLRAFDLASGQTLWRVSLDLPVSAGPSLVEGRLLLGTRQGHVVALDPDDGTELWRADVSSEVLAAPSGAAGTVVVRTVDGRLFGLTADAGERRWVYDRDVPVLTLRGTGRPVIENGIVVSGFDSGRLAAVSLNDGTVLWESPISVPRGRSELERMVDIDADPLVMDDVVYAVAYQGRLAALQLGSGQILWTRDIGSHRSLTADRRWLYLADSSGQVWALDRASGATVWKQDKLLRRSLSTPVLQGDYVVVGDYDGYLHWLSRWDGRLVARARVESPQQTFLDLDPPPRHEEFPEARDVLAPPVVAGDLLLATDRRGVISAYRLD